MSATTTRPVVSNGAGEQTQRATPARPKAGPALNFTAGLLIGTALWLPFRATADAGGWAAQTGTFGALGSFVAGLLLRAGARLRNRQPPAPKVARSARAGSTNSHRLSLCPGCN